MTRESGLQYCFIFPPVCDLLYCAEMWRCKKGQKARKRSLWGGGNAFELIEDGVAGAADGNDEIGDGVSGADGNDGIGDGDDNADDDDDENGDDEDSSK